MIVKEFLSFERGKDPKESMHIGLGNVIAKYMNDNEINDPFQWISFLSGAYPNFEWSQKLDKETRKKWINFLLSNPNKYIHKNSLDELDYELMKRWDIHWIPYVPIPDNNFKYVSEGDNYYLLFDGWESFSDYIEESKEYSENFINKVLEGDAFEYFYESIYKEYYKDLNDYIDFLDRKAKKSFEMIKSKILKLGLNLDNINNFKKLLEEIESNHKLYDIKMAILRAIVDAKASADEGEAFYIIKNAIKKYYEIGDKEIYEDKIKVPISFNGIEKLFYTIVTGDDKMTLFLPREIDGAIDEETITESINNQLENL